MVVIWLDEGGVAVGVGEGNGVEVGGGVCTGAMGGTVGNGVGTGVLLGKAPEAKPSKNAETTPTKQDKKPASGKGTYLVKKGDTLERIARKELGNSGRWEEILSLNSSSLDDETSLRAGMTIKLPR